MSTVVMLPTAAWPASHRAVATRPAAIRAAAIQPGTVQPATVEPATAEPATARVLTVAEVVRRAITSLAAEASAVKEHGPATARITPTAPPTPRAPSDPDDADLAVVLDLTPRLASGRRMTLER